MNGELLRPLCLFSPFFLRVDSCDYHLVSQRCLVGAVVALVVEMVTAALEHDLLGSVSIFGGRCVGSRLIFVGVHSLMAGGFHQVHRRS